MALAGESGGVALPAAPPTDPLVQSRRGSVRPRASLLSDGGD